MIRSIVGSGLSAVAKNQRVRNLAMGARQGLKGTARATGLALGAGAGYYSYGQRYGAGGGMLIGAGEAAAMEIAFSAGLIPGAIIAGGAYATYSAFTHGQEVYRRNRRLNFGQPMNDPYGTIRATRMHSIRNLSRDRSGLGRTLGNEARMLHR